MRKISFPALFVAIVATVGLFCASLGGFGRITPQGTQCPTASIQRVTVAVRDCCHRVVGYETRAPRAGERAFLQCRCAEKNEATHEATLSTKVELFLASRRSEPAVARPLLPFVRHPFTAAWSSVAAPPPFRPPTTA